MLALPRLKALTLETKTATKTETKIETPTIPVANPEPETEPTTMSCRWVIENGKMVSRWVPTSQAD